MMLQMALFEWRYFSRQPSFYISMLIFFSLSFMAPAVNVTPWGSINLNGPYFIAQVLLVFNMFALFLVVNFIASSALRDHANNMAEVLYCKPINSLSYQLGHFIGSFFVLVVVFSVVPLGLLLGSFMPWVNSDNMGSFNIYYYLTSYFYLSVPTLFSFACLFYALAIRFRSMMVVYLAVVTIFIVYEISDFLVFSPETRYLAAILDPFAGRTYTEISDFWTVVEKNTNVLTFNGVLLENRLTWIAVGAVMLALFGGFFRDLSFANGKALNKAKRTIKSNKVKKTEPAEASHPSRFVVHKGRSNVSWQQLIGLTRFEVKQVIFDRAFLILCLLSFAFLLGVLSVPKGLFGNYFWPVTNHMVEVIGQSMALLSLIVITYYSAEVIWREKTVGISEIIDSSPVKNITFWISKLFSVWLVLILLLVFSMVITILYQQAAGFENIDVSQYLIRLFYFNALPWMMMTVLAFLFQVVSPNRYIGMLLFVLLMSSGLLMQKIGIDHNLFRFAKSPQLLYSDMNGYDNGLLSHSWYMIYWGALSIVLGISGYGLWHRGPQQKLALRLKTLGYQIGALGKRTIVVASLIFFVSGSFIYYNTRVLNSSFSKNVLAEMHANYEKRYQQYQDAPIPTIVKLTADVDIFPNERKIVIDAALRIKNNTKFPVNQFLVSMPGNNPIFSETPDYSPVKFSLELEGGHLKPVDGELNTHWFEFEQPLLPGEEREGIFRVTRQRVGFSDKKDSFRVLANGTFVQNNEIFPRFGYQQNEALSSPKDRKKYALPAAPRAHLLEDTRYYKNSVGETVLGLNTGNLDFETTVSTSVGQTAISSGYLQKDWIKDNRHYFHYKMDAPIGNYFAFISGRYETRKLVHEGVELSVYYHPEHAMNVDRILLSMKDLLDYNSENFGPYQHRQMRVVEFAGPRDFGQDFPNMIAYSEQSGFIHDLRDKQANDQVYWFIAHEMSHQWWGGQVDGANVQGSTVIAETLAQYSAFMLYKKRYGRKKLREMLKYELDRYLTMRTQEQVEEMPLLREENQAYIHYYKGSIVMLSIADRIGEKRLNRALKAFLSKYKNSEVAFPTTLDLLAFITQDVNNEERIFIESLFKEINIYDLRITQANVSETADHRYEVTLNIDAKVFNVAGDGTEQKGEMSQLVDIGIFRDDLDDKATQVEPWYLQKHLVHSGTNEIKVIVSYKPVVAAVDPYINLIDRDIDNNIKVLELDVPSE